MRLFVISIISFLSLCISLIGNAGELKTIKVSPKVKIVQEEEGTGVNLRTKYKKVKFIDEKGSTKKEIDFSENSMTRMCISSNAQRIAANSNMRWKYSDKEREDFEKIKREAKKEGKQINYPKDYWGVLQNVVVYDDNGEIKQTIPIDIDVHHIYCSNKGEVVVHGWTRADRTGDRVGIAKLLFFNSKGDLVRSIDNQEAKEKNIAIRGMGKIYQEDKIVWVGEFGFAKGGAITLFDLKGNIIWQYQDEHLTLRAGHKIIISMDYNIIYIKEGYYDYKNAPVVKTWILDKNGKLLNLLNGWEHTIE